MDEAKEKILKKNNTLQLIISYYEHVMCTEEILDTKARPT